MSKDNPFWCDDCDRIARGLKDIWDDAPPLTTWCPNCGRLEDSEGTITPRKGAQDAQRIEALERLLKKARGLAYEATTKQNSSRLGSGMTASWASNLLEEIDGVLEAEKPVSDLDEQLMGIIEEEETNA